jgi:hypothetical protein
VTGQYPVQNNLLSTTSGDAVKSVPQFKKFIIRVHWIWISTMVSLFSEGSAIAQGFGATPIRVIPLKVVIMLGPEFDFKKSPFTDASEIKGFFDSGADQFTPPTLDTITVDVATPLPEGNEPIVVATYPPDTSEEELKKLKRSVQLNAIRFGINRIEMVAHDEQDPNSKVYSIWLRVPRKQNWEIQLFYRYAEIAVALGSQMDGQFKSDQARIDIFEGSGGPLPQASSAMRPATNDPFGGQAQSGREDPFSPAQAELAIDDDPFGGQVAAGSDDPFAPSPVKNEDNFGDEGSMGVVPPQDTDPFGANEFSSNPYGNTQSSISPFFSSGVPKTKEQLLSEIETIKKHRQSIQTDLEKTVRENEKPLAIQLARKLIAQDLQAQVRLQQLEILQLEMKLTNLKLEYRDRLKTESLSDVANQRLNKLFEAKP